MPAKYQRPSGAYAGQDGLANRSKYAEDAAATPRRPISSAKIDGDVNYLIDAVNQLDEASGDRASISERLDVSLNADGTLKVSVAGALDEWVVHPASSTLARVDNSTLTLSGGDFTGLYRPNRRVRVMVGGTALVGDVASCTHSGGVTTLTLVDVLDPAGNLGVIATDPTQVAYGPLTPGVQGNTPRRTDGLAFTLGANTLALGNTGTDELAFRLNGSTVAELGAAGLSGLAPESVALTTLVAAVRERLTPTGLIAPFAGTTAPTGWLLCGGQAVSRSTYAALFAALGTTYGAGDGTTTFNLPDLRGRTAAGRDDMAGLAANRLTSAGSGTNGAQLGAAGGSELLQAHSHGVTDPGHAHVQGLSWDGAVGTRYGFENTGLNASFWESGSGLVSPTGIRTQTKTTGITVQSNGGGGSQNVPPTLVLNYIIRT